MCWRTIPPRTRPSIVLIGHAAAAPRNTARRLFVAARPFSRTLSFLETEERATSGRFIALLTALLLAWLLWLTLSKATAYAVSEEGRLLAAGAASNVQTPVPGVIAETHLSLGLHVTAGEILVSIDSTVEELRRKEEEARLAGLNLACEALETIIRAERELGEANLRAGASRVQSAETRARVAADIAALVKQQDVTMLRLREAALASHLDEVKVAEQLSRERGQATIQYAERALAAADLDRARKESEVRLLNLMKDRVELKSRIAESRAVVAELEWEIARRTIRAPVSGIVADMIGLPKGSAVNANQVLGTVVPEEAMRWVAYFPPSEAVGRIQIGQSARIRLDAFPWTAYGAVSATVRGVGSEPREQRVRVELELLGDNRDIPLSHGMTGAVDVRVEELTPLKLLLRLSGQVAHVSPAPKPNPPAFPQAQNP